MPESSRTNAAGELPALLERVVLAEPTRAASLLAGFLGRADIEDISDEELDALIAALGPRIDRTATALRRSVSQSPLPMTPTARTQLAALFTLYRAAESLANLQLGLARGRTGADAQVAVASAHRRRVEWAAQLMLDCYQLYISVPQPLLADLHQFARAACRELADVQPTALDSVRDIYVAILLLGMVNPYALSVEEMADLYPCLREVAGEVEIDTERPSGSARFVDMTGRLAPHIALRGGNAGSDGAVYVGVDRLYHAETARRLKPACQQALQDFLRRLQFFLASRESRHREVHAATPGDRSMITIGFRSVHHRLLDETLRHVPPSPHLTLSGLDWEGLERPVRGQVSPSPSIRDFKLEIDRDARDEIDWEGRPAADRERHRQRMNEPATWEVVNLSERGLRLHWRLADNSRAAVDELILIERDPETHAGELDSVVGLGVVRWVRHLDVDNRTIDIGVERLDGDWDACFAHPTDTGVSGSGSCPVLVRQAGERIERLILPPELADRGEQLTVIREQGDDIQVKLERIAVVGTHFLVMEASHA